MYPILPERHKIGIFKEQKAQNRTVIVKLKPTFISNNDHKARGVVYGY